ncbi:hypothetical protein PSTG_05966 [Puccinia striiformis f. sp. tritici PST-78]|uniref:Uncharacterized protein n=1 Tax=Puccinia striiformis f. sp. tritici PST-78 TaxID=1165861 RepID=A0A0L0VNG8_9BASI|nr:hypothetical protein PSTG_05966 [Puccinia striiformis f. sp. tritici PST-78]
MPTKNKTYLDKVLNWDKIIIATALNLCFRLSISQVGFPSHHSCTQKLPQELYNQKKK